MLPPVDPGVLQRNTSFAILYKDLCTRKLNPDGSTRDTKRQRMHDEIRRNLTRALQTRTQTKILLQTLSTLPSTSPTLSLDLHQSIEIVSSLLTHQIPDSDREILSSDTSFFLTHIAEISAALSTQLATLATYLCKVASPGQEIGISGLATRAAVLKNTAGKELPEEIARSSTDLANSAYEVLTLHRQILEHSISILESTKHGVISRSMRASAELLASKATLLNLQAKIHGIVNAPPREFVEACRGYRKGLGVEERGLKDRIVVAERALELYERVGEKGMRDLAGRKGVLGRDIERVREELGRLERGEGAA